MQARRAKMRPPARINFGFAIICQINPDDLSGDLHTGVTDRLQPPTKKQMPHFVAENFIIVGVTSEGRKFRPSDWAERLCGIMSAFGSERRMTYSPYVQPGDRNGDKCVFVDGRIHDVEPMAYTFLVNFAKDNDLRVEPWSGGKP